jgi:hypothetical protein
MHATPQVPQLRGSVDRSAQFPMQRVSGAGHSARQLPALQTCGIGQATPQAPQLSELVCVLTHSPAQLSVPVGQLQTSEVQIVPPVQDTPHEPQLLASVCRSTHAPAHSVKDMLQCIWQ